MSTQTVNPNAFQVRTDKQNSSILLSHKRDEVFMYTMIQVNLEHIPSERRQTQKRCFVYFHLYERPQEATPQRQEVD